MQINAKKLSFILILSIILGIIISFLTGFYSNPSFVGGSIWGFPISFKQSTLSGPPNFSSQIGFYHINFLYNCVFWTVIVLIISIASVYTYNKCFGGRKNEKNQ